MNDFDSNVDGYDSNTSEVLNEKDTKDLKEDLKN
jgi:hypothetical protein